MKNKILKQKWVMALLAITLIMSTSFSNAYADNNATITTGTTITDNGITLKAYDWPLYSKDLSSMNLKNYRDFLKTVSFDKYTKWPSADKLPDNFNPEQIMEWGKNPGLGINDLHKQGYTGKGVNIAYVDQTLQPGHIEYSGTNVKYFIEDPTLNKNPSMHGSTVLSILAGRTRGIAPDANVYFVGDNNYTADELHIAQGIRKIIEINKTLPNDKKIKILGLSNSHFVDRANKGEYDKAINEAESAGIMVFDVATLNGAQGMGGMYIEPLKDRDNPDNYVKDPGLYGGNPHQSNLLCIPGTGTFADGVNKDDYTYWSYSGQSWLVPYLVGVISLGLQVDPTLTKEKAIQYLYDSATQTAATSGSRGLINPKGFIDLVKENSKNLTCINNIGDNDYYYLLYNSNRVTSDDLTSIKSYASQLSNNAVLVDVSNYVNYNENDIKNVTGMSAITGSFKNIYDYLKKDSLKRNGNLKGIQIFGGVEDIPGCFLYHKIKNSDTEIDGDQGGGDVTDFFYNNFDNDSSIFTPKFSIYSMFDGSTNVKLAPEWKVARIPLKSGEYKSFIMKYNDYVVQAKNQGNIPLVNFTNPIFPSDQHIDDAGYFLNRLNGEFGILPNNSYKLYGNLDGKYPVTTKVLGNFTKENLIKENSQGIEDFFIDSHGQQNNIDQAIFDKTTGKEQRISLVNSSNVNQVLNKNYYTFNLWTCNNELDLRNDTLVHEVLANGKCVNAIATSQEISNRGVDNKASLEDMKNNNYFYFQYLFYKNLNLNYSRTDSFFEAQKGYLKGILNHQVKSNQGYYDYQYNLQNVMSVHYLGLLDSANFKITNITGSTPLKEAVAISKSGWDQSESVCLVSGADFPDALAGSSLAIVKDAPILYTYSAQSLDDHGDSSNLDEIARLRAKRVYIFGGTSVVSQGIEDNLRNRGLDVIRLSGSDRFGTAKAVGDELVKINNTHTMFLAYAYNFPDALAASTFAGKSGCPIMLSNKSDLDSITQNAIKEWGINTIYIVGGIGAVSQGVENTLTSQGIKVIRISGKDRYDTAQNIIKNFKPDVNCMTVTTGTDFHSALAGSVYGYKTNQPVMLFDKGMDNIIKKFVWSCKNIVCIGNNFFEYPTTEQSTKNTPN